MKNIIRLLLSLCVIGPAAFALGSPQWFTTLAQAKQNCALPSNITFNAYRPAPSSAGILSGTNQAGDTFVSYNAGTKSKTVLHPSTMPIEIQFEKRGLQQAYGFKINKTINCYYQYTAFNGTLVHASMTTAMLP